MSVPGAHPPQELIRCENAVKIYTLGDQQVAALNGVSFTIAQGEFVAIMGPSGSGKSTLMNLLGALDTPTSGRLVIAGQDLAGLDSDGLADLRNTTIGFVFQLFNLLARTSALDNVKLPLLYAREPQGDLDARARACLEEVGLGERLDHQPSQLSGGQQQRVAIARALVNDPQMLLADEPTGALDTKTSAEIMALFQNFNARGKTVIIVTHEPDVAAYASRRILLRDGEIVEDVATEPRAAGGSSS